MMVIAGKITEKSDKPWNGINLYSFKVEGYGQWFKTGQKEIQFDEGETVTFEERNGRVDAEKVTYSVDAPPLIVPAVLASDQIAPVVPMDTIGRRIQWQNARADACRLVCAALTVEGVVEGGVLPWPKNLAKAKRLDHLTGYINELTKQFVEEEVV